jgi:Fic family protein
VYGNIGKTESIIATAAAHHRLPWIHPFTDGNGRVARLMSHAMMLDTLDTGAVWSVARARIGRPRPSRVVVVTPSNPVFVCVTGVTFCAE